MWIGELKLEDCSILWVPILRKPKTAVFVSVEIKKTPKIVRWITVSNDLHSKFKFGM